MVDRDAWIVDRGTEAHPANAMFGATPPNKLTYGPISVTTQMFQALHMPPLQSTHKPRVVIYHQTHFRNGQFVSALPLITEAEETISVTHLIIAAIHINQNPNEVTLNDDPPNAPQYDQLWEEVAIFQDVGVSVLGLLGGAARGSFQRLDGSDAEFEAYYAPISTLIQDRSLNGLDLDVEEEMSLQGIIRLIDRLKGDFGSEFIITLAPVATALQGRQHLSGFDYEALEVMRGNSISFYNCQFYNGWGRLDSFVDFDAILQQGWKPEKVVPGVLTNPSLGNGYIDFERLKLTVAAMSQYYPGGFGGIFGWEYFNSQPGDESKPWEWAEQMGQIVRTLRTPR